jgi:hypothetical protein
MSVSPQHYAEFLRKMGHTVRESDGVYWCNSQRGVYSPFPYHREVDALTLDIRAVLRRDGLALRFGCPVEQGVSSYRITCDDRSYDFPSLRSRTRTQVRRGLEACRIEQVEFATLARCAHSLNEDTLIRQGRRVPANLVNHWNRYYRFAAETPGAEAWAAFVGDELAAYLISFTMETVANLLILRSSLKFLNEFPNNALLFRFLQERLSSGQVSEICYGYESIQAELGSLDQFKTGMGFRKAPSGQRVELAAWVRPLLNRFTTPMALRLVQAFNGEEGSAKLRGMLDWHARQPLLGTRSQRAA